jgi:hypothetical protein
MDKTSMTLGWLVGRQIAGQLSVKRRQKYRLGILKAITLPIQGNFPHASTWSTKVWNNNNITWADRIWTDGRNFFFWYDKSAQYVLNGDTWEEKVWNGGRPSFGWNVWSDGTNIYCSYGDDCQLVLE